MGTPVGGFCVVIPKLLLEIGSENVGQREVGGLRHG